MTEIELLQRFEEENPDLGSLPESTRQLVADSVIKNTRMGIPLETALDAAAEVAREVFEIPRPASRQAYELESHLAMLNQDRKKRGQL